MLYNNIIKAMDRQVRKKENSEWLKLAALAFFLVIIIVLILANINLYNRNKILEQRGVSLQEDMRNEKEKQAKLNEQIKEIGKKDYEEKIIREKGMYKRKGEAVVVVLGKESAASSTKPAPPKNDFFASVGELFSKMFHFLK